MSRTKPNDVEWRDYVYYDPSSPTCLRWIRPVYKSNGSECYQTKADGVAGSSGKGAAYFTIKLNQKSYRVSRVIYELLHGPLPEGMVVDHIDGDSFNNCLDNLRLVNDHTNARNARKRKDNTTGKTGVYFVASEGCWKAGWYDLERNRKSKTFYVSKWGDEAFDLACAYRDKMIHELNVCGADYSERHGV